MVSLWDWSKQESAESPALVPAGSHVSALVLHSMNVVGGWRKAQAGHTHGVKGEGKATARRLKTDQGAAVKCAGARVRGRVHRGGGVRPVLRREQAAAKHEASMTLTGLAAHSRGTAHSGWHDARPVIKTAGFLTALRANKDVRTHQRGAPVVRPHPT